MVTTMAHQHSASFGALTAPGGCGMDGLSVNIHADNDTYKDATRVKVSVCPDLPGQLQAMGATFSEFGLIIQTASIAHDEDHNGFITGKRLEADFAVMRPTSRDAAAVVGSLPQSVPPTEDALGDAARTYQPSNFTGDSARECAGTNDSFVSCGSDEDGVAPPWIPNIFQASPSRQSDHENVEGEALEAEEIGALVAALEASLMDAVPMSISTPSSSASTPSSSKVTIREPAEKHVAKVNVRPPGTPGHFRRLSWDRTLSIGSGAATPVTPDASALPSHVTVAQIMSSPVVAVDANDDVQKALSIMQAHGIASLLVVDRRARAVAHASGATPPPPSIITKRDFVTLTAQGLFAMTALRVRDVCTRRPLVTIPPSSSIDEASRLLKKKNIRRLVVHDAWATDVSDEPTLDELDVEADYEQDAVSSVAGYVGIISDTDIFSAFTTKSGRRVGTPSADPVSARNDDLDVERLLLDADPGIQEHRIPLEDIVFQGQNYMGPHNRLGIGGFGEVFKGKCVGTTVAVKRLIDQAGTDVLREFAREVSVLRKLRHPRVVLWMGVIIAPQQLSIVLEYMDRGSLSSVVHKRTPDGKMFADRLTTAMKMTWSSDIAEGMAYLHSKHIIHRDLTSNNVLVNKKGQAKITDFGLSKVKTSRLSQTSSAKNHGAAYYCAPEALRNDPYDYPCDVFSFGVILWELMHRQRPFYGVDIYPFIASVQREGSRFIRSTLEWNEAAIDGVPQVKEIALRCWVDTAKDRPTFQQLVGELVLSRPTV
ncbi:protein kinase domain-containing protein [Pseudoscourfieldia marina]